MNHITNLNALVSSFGIVTKVIQMAYCAAAMGKDGFAFLYRTLCLVYNMISGGYRSLMLFSFVSMV